MESIKQLRVICQLSYEGWDDQPWIYFYIRKISVYFTWLLLHLPFSANTITLMGIAIGLLSGVLFGLNEIVGGAATLFLTIILDFCDGEICRYRNQYSKEGSYLDFIFHFVVQPSVFAGITLGVYQLHHSTWVIVLGFVCTISTFVNSMVRHYAKYIVLWLNGDRIIKKLLTLLKEGTDLQSAMDAIAASKNTAGAGAPSTTIADNLEKTQRSGIGRTISLVIEFWEFPYIFIVVIVLSLLQVFGVELIVGASKYSCLVLGVIFYSLTFPIIIITVLFYTITTKAIGKEYDAFIRDLSALVKQLS